MAGQYLLSLLLWLVGWVDTRRGGQLRWLRRPAHEPFGVGGVGGVEDTGSLVPHGLGEAVVDVRGCMKSQAGVAMLVVVPGEEVYAVQPCGLDRGEPVGEVGPVLQRLELRLAEGVVVGDVRPRMRLGDAEVSEQECDRLGGHRTA